MGWGGGELGWGGGIEWSDLSLRLEKKPCDCSMLATDKDWPYDCFYYDLFGVISYGCFCRIPAPEAGCPTASTASLRGPS